MKQRIITGIIILGVIATIGLLHNIYLIFIFLMGLHLIAIYETVNLFKLKKNLHYYTVSILLWISTIFLKSGLDLILILTIIIFSYLAYKPEKVNLKILLPFFYPTISFLTIFELYKMSGIEAFVLLILVVALTDTMAYFVGKKFGKRQFSPTSPNKTLEGVFGGIGFGTLSGTIFLMFEYSQFNFFSSILIAFILAVSSVFGDLFESYLKRHAEIKDSDHILPGHGGILDRVDGYLFSSVILFIIFKNIL